MIVYEKETCCSSYSIFYLACRLHMHPLLFTVSDKFLNAPYIHVCMHAGYLISNCVSVKNYSFSLWIVSSLDLLEGTGKRLFTPNFVHVTNVGCMARVTIVIQERLSVTKPNTGYDKLPTNYMFACTNIIYREVQKKTFPQIAALCWLLNNNTVVVENFEK